MRETFFCYPIFPELHDVSDVQSVQSGHGVVQSWYKYVVSQTEDVNSRFVNSVPVPDLQAVQFVTWTVLPVVEFL